MSINIHGINVSYDYEDLLNELRGDLSEGLIKIDSLIGIERGSIKRFGGEYAPIIDYFYNPYEGKEVKTVKEVIKEMEKLNSIL